MMEVTLPKPEIPISPTLKMSIPGPKEFLGLSKEGNHKLRNPMRKSLTATNLR